MKHTLFLTFSNGQQIKLDFNDLREAYDYARNKVSFSVMKRLEIGDPESKAEHRRALWDREWDDASKLAGMRMPK